jgi:hypothetical protein
MPQFFSALKFCFGNSLTGDDACPEPGRRVFGWHGLLILPCCFGDNIPLSVTNCAYLLYGKRNL